MTKTEIIAYCITLPGVLCDDKVEWAAKRFLVGGAIEEGGKMFAMLGGDKAGTPILTLKCDPLMAGMIRERYEDIIPGYYMNKQNWNSVYYEKATVPDHELMRMLQEAHRLILMSLSKRKRDCIVRP